ncbi:hypothetical protein [Rathayibacter sp. AY1C5]|uniref:hypothetical protein n=1 Tax=Rathayibacter sp. AY1C5 TaxID=2080538 RepID=UPI0011AFD7E4|nr:hypothetical protein [Rathayibacter sp. AY1C5]
MAGKYNFTIEQGVAFTRVITWKDGSGAPVNLTNKTARMQVRDADGTVLLTLTDTDGLTLGGVAGTIAIELSSARTTALDFDTANYDLEITEGTSVVKRLLKGVVTLDQEVTV